MKFLIKERFIIIEDIFVEIFEEYKSKLTTIVKTKVKNKLFRYLVRYIYNIKLREQEIPKINCNFYLLIREKLVLNVF